MLEASLALQRHSKLRTCSKLRTALQHYSATVLQRYSATASWEPSSDLLKISARSNTNENHALQAPFDQFSAPAAHLPFLASIPDVPMLGGLLACWPEP